MRGTGRQDVRDERQREEVGEIQEEQGERLYRV